MARRKTTDKFLVAILIGALVVGVYFGPQIATGVTNLVDVILGNTSGDGGQTVDFGDADVVTSRFTGTGVKEDAVATNIGTATVYIWFDWNGDGIMQRSAFGGIADGVLMGGEIEEAASASGVFTSPSEYPIGEVIHLLIDDGGEAYQMTYHKFSMYGSPHDDGSAKAIGNIECRATDDAPTYAGLVRGIALDDSTNYNYTLNGAEGNMEIRVTFATSDAGANSQTSPDFYSGSGPWTHWGSGVEFAPSFLGMYMTNQDFTDLAPDAGAFDVVYRGASNTYCAKFLVGLEDQLFYDSDMTAAPTFVHSVGVSISANTTLIYVGLFQDLKWSDFSIGIWRATTDAYILGTLGADWDINNG